MNTNEPKGLKIAAITPFVSPGAFSANTKNTLDAVLAAEKSGAQLVVLPKNSFSGEVAGLRQMHTVNEAILSALFCVVPKTSVCLVVGLTFFDAEVAVICHGGKIKTVILQKGSSSDFGKLGALLSAVEGCPVGSGDYIFDEFCVTSADDSVFDIRCGLNVPDGLTKRIAKIAKTHTPIVAVPASYPTLLGGSSRKQAECANLSLQNGCTVVISCCGAGETVSRFVRSGDKIIARSGTVLSFADYDKPSASAQILGRTKKTKTSTGAKKTSTIAKNQIDYTPRYLPTPEECGGVWDILARGIVGRMREAKAKCVIFGLSGGLDSACTLIAAAHAEKYGLPRKDIICVLMPSQHSSKQTQTNAQKLAQGFGVTALEIPIGNAVDLHMRDLNHSQKDVVYENAQARERAQILHDLSGKYGAIVLGTSDLSEMALGFSTFGGDQLAHYNPNSSLTKSCIRFLVRNYAENLKKLHDALPLAEVLLDVLSTPISPELLPDQHTEKILGDYALHEFFLLQLLAYKQCGRDVLDRAILQFSDFDTDYIKNTYRTFVKRFFWSRFKTNFACDGIMLTPYDLSSITLNSDFNPEIFDVDNFDSID